MRLVVLLLCAIAASAVQVQHDDEQWWEHGTFYQIYPRSFKDSDGDGVGDIRGIIESLDHLEELGVTGVWLGPVFKSPMRDGGYDIADYREVDPLFGNNTDLDNLFAELKERDIKIILDFVPNHTSDRHDWFTLSMNRAVGYEDFYIWRDCPIDFPSPLRRLPNNWISVYHTEMWTYHPTRDQCYLHQFTHEQPDLNFNDPGVQREIKSVMTYWLDKGVDGFRIDNTNRLFEHAGLGNEGMLDGLGDRTRFENIRHQNTIDQTLTYEFIRELRELMDNYTAASNQSHARIIMTHSTWSSLTNHIRWYTSGSHVPLNPALITELPRNFNAFNLSNSIYAWLDLMPVYDNVKHMPNWQLGSHDHSRVGSRFGANRLEGMAMVSMMLPGVHVIYNGEEIGMMDNNFITREQSDDPQVRQTNETVFPEFTRDPARTPFQWDNSLNAGFSNSNTSTPWLPIHPNYVFINLKDQKLAERSTFKIYKALIELRKTKRVLQIGTFVGRPLGENIYGFMRTLRGDHTIAVIFNFGTATRLNMITLLGDEMNDNTRAQVLVSSRTSPLLEGNFINNIRDFELGTFNAIVVEFSSASKFTVSILLLLSVTTKILF